MSRRSPALVGLACVALLVVGPELILGAETDLAEARQLWLAGKYAEAQEAYEKLVAKDPTAAALGIARCLVSVGEAANAGKTLTAAIEKQANQKPANIADLQAARAELAFEQGEYATADAAIAAALKIKPDHLLARWLQAERWRTVGKLDEAAKAYKWFVDYYNDHDALDTDSLLVIGRAAAQYARWQRLSDQFTFLVNDLYPGILEQDEHDSRAHYEAGLLYLEKYNEAESSRELKAALKLNPAAADVYAALARQALQNYDLDDARRNIATALEINPRCLEARLAEADAHLANFELREAIATLDKARELNPLREETLGRLAGTYAVVDGIRDDVAGTRFGKLAAEVEERNPHCGAFYLAAAGVFDLTRKFPAGARYYRLAAERMPQLLEPRGALGLMEMRLGDETAARKDLEASFEADPFNVRVSNSLKVLEVLDNYAVLETAHFVLKFDRGKDEILARHAARYLEEQVYPVLTKQYGYEPRDKSLFEIFNRAKNTGGHGWFSARMVGLPYVGTVGACAGKMVALASPNDMGQPFNWARVLKHEFVHVLNLQQSNFNIPHWYTEALAVESEGYPRQQTWNEMLVERVPKGKMFNLDTINLGFVRPKSGEDWQMAYCQAQLYAQYMLKTYGDDALAKMLQCYADNLDTRAALKRSFDVEQEKFEAGYLAHVKELVTSLAAAAPAESPGTMAQLMREHQQKPDDVDVAARLANAQLARKMYPEARKLAESVVEKQPRHALAAFVLARVRMVIGDDAAALKLLEAAVDRDKPETNSLGLLASMKLRAEKFDEATELYRLAAKTWPHDGQWTKALARLYLKAGDNKRLAGVLAQLAEQDADDFIVRKKLAYMAIEAKDYADARRWAQQALYVNVQDADCHRVIGEACAAEQQWKPAIEAYRDAIQLNPKQAAWRFALADVHLQQDDTKQAIVVLKELLEMNPKYPGAAILLESLEEKP